MGLFNRNKTKTRPIIDDYFGELEPLTRDKNNSSWIARRMFNNAQIEIYLDSIDGKLINEDKSLVINILNNSDDSIEKCIPALREEYSNADKSFENWQDVFSLVAITCVNGELELSFEEKESYYHFNVHIDKSGSTYVSVDS